MSLILASCMAVVSKQHNKSATGLFYWSFVFVVFFLLLNMVLSVVFDTYADIRNEQKEREEEEGAKNKESKGILNNQKERKQKNDEVKSRSESYAVAGGEVE